MSAACAALPNMTARVVTPSQRRIFIVILPYIVELVLESHYPKGIGLRPNRSKLNHFRVSGQSAPTPQRSAPGL
jgi:hypothetical protein